MFELSREVYICKCSTDVREVEPEEPELRRMRFARGRPFDLARLSPRYHDVQGLTEMQTRLQRGEHWLIGEVDDEIVTYTWLLRGPIFYYPSLPGCSFRLRADTAYGYGAWTPDHLRGRGYRRHTFVEELRILRGWGKRWEASVFVKSQLERGTRNLARVGIHIVPLWRVTYTKEHRLVGEPLADDDCVTPLFDPRGGVR